MKVTLWNWSPVKADGGPLQTQFISTKVGNDLVNILGALNSEHK